MRPEVHRFHARQDPWKQRKKGKRKNRESFDKQTPMTEFALACCILGSNFTVVCQVEKTLWGRQVSRADRGPSVAEVRRTGPRTHPHVCAGLKRIGVKGH